MYILLSDYWIRAYHKCITSHDAKQRRGINPKPFPIFGFNFQAINLLMQYGYEGWVRMSIHPHIALIHSGYPVFVASKRAIGWFKERLTFLLVHSIAFKHHSLHGLVKFLQELCILIDTLTMYYRKQTN